MTDNRLTEQEYDVLRTITPCVVNDGGLFEAKVVAPPSADGVTWTILYQGERTVAEVIAKTLNAERFRTRTAAARLTMSGDYREAK